ncbi:MAG: GNAT family N-acetyltransferase [Bacteroidetes bacterium]|nr:GNAT family N-acetyltransferase [Bacteroidota bacterium]HNR20059.1 GNAT family N-acetyltransferase [Bacteroidia bacterium]HNU32650.1 GNAT family N-acetyltransferase [Bacteroidia bacterium]
MNDLLIRRANVSDIEEISTLASKIWWQHYASIISKEQIEYMLEKMYSPESLSEQIKNAHIFLLALYKGAIIGYLSLYKKGDQSFFLDKLYVANSLQRKSVGGDLIREAYKIVGDGNIRLQVNRKNFKAINFYFKEDFKIEAVEDFDIGNNFEMNDFIMIKSIKK